MDVDVRVGLGATDEEKRAYVLVREQAEEEATTPYEAKRRAKTGEVRKGARRMPRCQEPTKDGANTEMPRGAVSEH